jgi:hypothetical protein
MQSCVEEYGRSFFLLLVAPGGTVCDDEWLHLAMHLINTNLNNSNLTNPSLALFLTSHPLRLPKH